MVVLIALAAVEAQTGVAEVRTIDPSNQVRKQELTYCRFPSKT